MAALTAQTITTSGVQPTVIQPGASGDTVPINARVRVSNGTAGSITITLTTHKVADGDLTIPDRTISIPAGEVRNILAGQFYRDPTDGLVDITSSDTTSSVEYEVTI